MQRISALFVLLFIFSDGVDAQDCVVSVESELKRLYAIDELPGYLTGTKVFQESSYDRTGFNNDGFEGKYSYLYKTKEDHLVVFEAKGKGVIERIWTPTPTEDTLDFYFDGSKVPSLSVRYNDLFSGKVFPFVAPLAGHKVGGFYNYFPIPFNDGCRIVFRGMRILFHQFQYRKLNDSCRVQTFDQDAVNSKELLNKIASLWNDRSFTRDLYPGIVSVKKKGVLKPGNSIQLATFTRGGRVVGIELDNAEQFETPDNLVDIKITYDDEKFPAIIAPVADFFGYAFGKRSMRSLLLGVDSANKAYCYFPMPFDGKATIELVYRNKKGAKPIDIQSSVYYQATKRRSAEEGKLYVHWKRDEPSLGTPYVFLEGKGRGHYVGTILQSQGKSYTEFTEFFEGDDSTVIDGVNAIHGTGSEDYFNGGWYAQPGGWVERLGTHLHGCLDYTLPYSRTGGYRWYISDKLPFDRSIYHSIEHGPEKNNRAVRYTSLAFYYADKPVQQNMVPSNNTSKVFIPDTITFYARLMDHISYQGSMVSRDGAGFLEKGKEGAVNIRVNEIQPGTYDLYMDVQGKGFHKEGTINIDDVIKPLSINLKAAENDIRLHRVMLVKR